MATPLRAILHVLQIIFLLFALLMFALLVGNMVDAAGITWDAEYELSVAVAIMSVLLAIAFSPGLWSVVKNSGGSPAPGSDAPSHYGPPVGGQVPPPATGQVPPPATGQAPPTGTYGR